MMDYPMYTAPAAVSQSLDLDIIDGDGNAFPIQGELRYDPADPFAVTAAFHTGSGTVAWTFGRELLCTGIYEPAGDGDVHVWPCLDSTGHAVVIIELCSPDGEALLQALSGQVNQFVERMNAAVPEGTESDHLNMDAALRALLDAAA